MSVRVRLAEAGDVAGIVNFGSTVIPPHYAPILGIAAAQAQLAWWTFERMASAVTAGRVGVAVAGEHITGVVETGELAGEEVIWKLYLDSEFRGHSLGVELLRNAIVALPVGTDHVLVEHFAGNARAGAFYQREGFAVVKTEPASSGNVRAGVVWRRLEL